MTYKATTADVSGPRGRLWAGPAGVLGQRAVRGAVNAVDPEGASVPAFAAARLLPPVTASPPAGTNMAWLKVDPVGALARGRIGYALPPDTTEVEM